MTSIKITRPIANITWSNLIQSLYNVSSYPTNNSNGVLLFTQGQYPYVCNIFGQSVTSAVNQIIRAPNHIGRMYVIYNPIVSSQPTIYQRDTNGNLIAKVVSSQSSLVSEIPSLVKQTEANTVYFLYTDDNQKITNIQSVYGLTFGPGGDVTFYTLDGCIPGKSNTISLPPSPPTPSMTISNWNDVANFLTTLQAGYGSSVIFQSVLTPNPCDTQDIQFTVDQIRQLQDSTGKQIAFPDDKNQTSLVPNVTQFPSYIQNIVFHRMSGQPIVINQLSKTQGNFSEITNTLKISEPDIVSRLPSLAKDSHYIYLATTDNLGNALQISGYEISGNPSNPIWTKISCQPEIQLPPDVPVKVKDKDVKTPSLKKTNWMLIIGLIIGVIIILLIVLSLIFLLTKK